MLGLYRVSLEEVYAGMDAAFKPIGTYSRRLLEVIPDITDFLNPN